jgi:hypothetical protein
MKNQEFKDFFYKLRDRKKEQKKAQEVIEVDANPKSKKRSTDDEIFEEPKRVQSKIKLNKLEQIEQLKIARGIEREIEFQNRLRIQKETTLLVTGNKSINPFFTKKIVQRKREQPRIVEAIRLPGKEFYTAEQSTLIEIQTNFNQKTSITPVEFLGKSLLDHAEQDHNDRSQNKITTTTTTTRLPNKPKKFSNSYYKSLITHLKTPQDIKSCILLGPTGSGKTIAVHKACQTLHLPLIEINTTQKLTSKTLAALFRNKQCVYLIDDFDIQFKCDQGFLETILRILKTDTYTMVFTMTENMDWDVDLECYEGKLFGNEVVKSLLWDRSVVVDELDVLLDQWNVGETDFRGLLNNVEFYCRFPRKNVELKEIIMIEDQGESIKNSKVDSQDKVVAVSGSLDATSTDVINEKEPGPDDAELIECYKNLIDTDTDIIPNELKTFDKAHPIVNHNFEVAEVAKEINNEVTEDNTEEFIEFDEESIANEQLVVIDSEFSDEDSYQSDVEPVKVEKQFTVIKITQTDRKQRTISELSTLLDLKSAIKYTFKPKEVCFINRFIKTLWVYIIS